MYSKAIINFCATTKAQFTTRRLLLRRWVLVLVLLLSPLGAVQAQGFAINHAEIILSDKVYHLNASLDFDFSSDVLEAINNGVPLVLELIIEILEPRRYWYDDEVATLEQRYQLQFHALTEQYIVINLNSGAQYTFFSLSAALQKIGNVNNLPVIDEQLLEDKNIENYYARIRTTLGFDNLPVPLKLDAWTSRSWWLGTDWVELEL